MRKGFRVRPSRAMAKEDTFETLRFLTPELCFEIADKVGTPCYAYDLDTLKKCVPLQLCPVHACFAVQAV